MNEALTSHSVLSLVSQAGPVVKLVMLALLVASVVSWGIIIDKYRRFKRISRESVEFEERFWSGGNVAKLS
ncbi:MAG: protein TolQ, partial [Magnetococcales bacterium]|nr:protein TolQ [Magnetococcales bacterium]